MTAVCVLCMEGVRRDYFVFGRSVDRPRHPTRPPMTRKIDYRSIECAWPGCPHVGPGEHDVYIIEPGNRIALATMTHWLNIKGGSIGTRSSRKRYFPRTRVGYRKARDAARNAVAACDRPERRAYAVDHFGSWGLGNIKLEQVDA